MTLKRLILINKERLLILYMNLYSINRGLFRSERSLILWEASKKKQEETATNESSSL